MFDRTRWSAIGAAVAVTLAAGAGLPGADATNTDGGGSGGVFVSVVPCRLFDTRATSTVGLRSAPLAANDTFTQPVTGTHGNCTIPAQATGVAMNVTAVNPTATSYLTVYPSDAPQPTASNLNWVAGAPATPNKVDVKLSADGRVNLFNNGGTVDVVGDIVGYYTGHDHDDRYYTKAETDALIDQSGGLQVSILPPSVMSLRQTIFPGAAIGPRSVGNCLGTTNAADEGHIPLVIPYPAVRLAASVNVLDGTGVVPFNVSLVKLSMTSSGLTSTVLATQAFPGTLTTQVVNATLSLPDVETIGTTDSYEVVISGFGDSHNAFCGGALFLATQETIPAIPAGP